MLSVPAGGRPKAETVKVVKAHRGPSNDHVHAHHILLFHAPAYSKTFSSATKSPGIVQDVLYAPPKVLCFLNSLIFDRLVSAIADPATRRETITWIRSEFERNRHLTDVVSTPWNNICSPILVTHEPVGHH